MSKELDAYRQSLLRYRFEQRYIAERLDTSVTDKEVEDYYDSHKDNFKLERPVLKARFMKIAKASPNLQKIRKLMSSEDVGIFLQSETKGEHDEIQIIRPYSIDGTDGPCHRSLSAVRPCGRGTFGEFHEGGA